MINVISLPKYTGTCASCAYLFFREKAFISPLSNYMLFIYKGSTDYRILLMIFLK